MTDKQKSNNNRGRAMAVGLVGYIIVGVLAIFFVNDMTLKASILAPMPTIALQIISHYFEGRRNGK